MATVNYSIKLINDSEADLICDSCGGSSRQTRQQLKAWLARGGEMEERCPACSAPYVDSTPTMPHTAMNNEFVRFGRTIAEVLTHRGQVEDSALDANIGFILLDKEERLGLGSFSPAERHVYAVQGMMREVSNGGFAQFFLNSSGELAFDLLPALEAMGSRQLLKIAQQAVALFGHPPSLDADARELHVNSLTAGGKRQLWEGLDEAFFDAEENIESMIIEYLARMGSGRG